MKRLMLVFILLLCVSFVYAADEWGDYIVEDEDLSGEGVGGEEEIYGDENAEEEDVIAVFDDNSSVVYDTTDSSDAETEYTQSFYIALGVVGVGILIVLLFVYLFLRSPKNKWKK